MENGKRETNGRSREDEGTSRVATINQESLDRLNIVRGRLNSYLHEFVQIFACGLDPLSWYFVKCAFLEM